jgi:hypothetical protein
MIRDSEKLYGFLRFIKYLAKTNVEKSYIAGHFEGVHASSLPLALKGQPKITQLQRQNKIENNFRGSRVTLSLESEVALSRIENMSVMLTSDTRDAGGDFPSFRSTSRTQGVTEKMKEGPD